jgi:uncharacterized membrane protein (UPF0127 family)
VKLHCRDFEEDFGLLIPKSGASKHDHIHLFENGLVKVTNKIQYSPVAKVKALWLEKDARVHCEVADTEEKKKIGLQGHPPLEDDRGLYFPYPGRADVAFHQGSVDYPLDILFLRDGELISIVRDTKVGSKDHWTCKDCDGVIETGAGWCYLNLVDVGDRLSLFACSVKDHEDLEIERRGGVVQRIVEDEDD